MCMFLLRKALNYLIGKHNRAIMINYESLMYVKNPCDFAVVWKSEYPEYDISSISIILAIFMT